MDVHEAIRTRRSVREYSSRAIPAETLGRMQLALRSAPSACNYQPWRFIFVTDAELRRKLASAAMDQRWIAEAPVIVVGCGLPGGAYRHMGGEGNSAIIDVAIALDHLTLAAVAEGLGTCWIGAFEEAGVKKLLRIPAEVKPVALTPLGYPAAADLNHPLEDGNRKAPSEVFCVDYYGTAMKGE